MKDSKTRHGCLTVWLVILISFNVIAAMGNLARSGTGWQEIGGDPKWPFTVLSLLALLNIVFAIALFKWKKWGFYGFCLAAVSALAINLLIGVRVIPSLIGLAGVLALYIVLHIGKDKKAWSQLE